jgi:hypothetical protein
MAGLVGTIGKMCGQFQGEGENPKKVEHGLKIFGEHIRHAEGFKYVRGQKAWYERPCAERKAAQNQGGCSRNAKREKGAWRGAGLPRAAPRRNHAS